MLPIKTGLASLVFLAAAGCGEGPDEPELKYCDGPACFTFNRKVESSCQTQDDPTARGIFGHAVSGIKTDDGLVSIVYGVERRRDTGVRYDETPPQIRKAALGREILLACDTGRDTVVGVPKTKLLHYIVPKCSSSHLYNDANCGTRPPAEHWPPDYRFPRDFSKVAIGAPTLDCKRHCVPGNESPQCLRVDVPREIYLATQLRGLDWSKALADLRQELIVDRNYPIAAARWKALTGIDPAEFGRGADIELSGDVIHQDGQPGPLPFAFEDSNGKVRADLSISRMISGRRIITGDILEWLPDPSLSPVVNFPESTSYQAILGGPVTQMYLSTNRLVMSNGNMCISVAY